MFPNGDALNHHLMWDDPILKFVPLVNAAPQRIIGVVADMDDVNVVPVPTMTMYCPFAQEAAMGGGGLFVHVSSNPYALVTPITRIMHNMSGDQPVEHAATLDDVRTEVLSSDRLNVVVFSVFAGVALLIAVVGVAGVLAFSVSGRTREFGIRLAVGSQRRHLLSRVMGEGAFIGDWRTCAWLCVRLWAGAAGRHFSRRSEAAGRAACGRFGFSSAHRCHNSICNPRGEGCESGCHASAA